MSDRNESGREGDGDAPEPVGEGVGSTGDEAGPTATPTPTGERPERSRWGVLLPALVGAAMTFLIVFVPFAPALGGLVAGYLRNGTRREGAAVGGLSGLLVALPVGLLGPLVLAFVVPVPPGPVPVRASLAFLLVALFGLLLAALYFVGLGAVGGVAAVVLRERNR